MPLIKYEDFRFSKERQIIIARARELIANYREKGYNLTLRQLYYQFVSRDWLPPSWADPATGSTNNEKSYKKLGDTISDGRMAGLIDWHAIEDRTRSLSGNAHWENPQEILNSVAHQFKLDKWDNQKFRIEVWVEKDALEGVVARTCRELDISYFSCRGYASMTSIWDAGQRLKNYSLAGQTPLILHFGDHDPSGIDMSRDIEERVSLFMGKLSKGLKFLRVALNMDQVRQYNPPPNPAKVTDSRFKNYVAEYGDECWELDALEPSVIDTLIREQVSRFRDERLYAEMTEIEESHKSDLGIAAEKWENTIVPMIREEE